MYQGHFTPKTIGNRKRDCASGCARGINTTWENLQIEKHKWVRWAERTPFWFVLFYLQSFSGGVYPPSSTSQTISFLFPVGFGINLILFCDFSTRGRTVQPDRLLCCFDSLSRNLTMRRMRTVWKNATFLATESVNSVPFKRGKI